MYRFMDLKLLYQTFRVFWYRPKNINFKILNL